MRIFLIAALGAIVQQAPAAAETRNFGISSFDRIRVDGPFKVQLSVGVAPFARATGSATAINRVAIDVEGQTLVIHSSTGSWGGYPGQSSGPVEIAIGTHELTRAWLNGAGSLAIDRVSGLSFDLALQGSGSIAIRRADVDQLSIGLNGSGSAVVAGRAGKLTAVVRGISALDASGLSVKDATIGAEGPATVRAIVTNSAKIEAAGASTVDLAGSPACTVKITGSASVSGCAAPRY